MSTMVTYCWIWVLIMLSCSRGYTTLNTNCTHCNDDNCEPSAECNECQGFEPPECREPCESGQYGINCKDRCSEGCLDTCNTTSGECSCKDWWDGHKCTLEIVGRELPPQELMFSDSTESSIRVSWIPIRDVPDEIASYYRYYVDYRLKGDLPYMTYTFFSHVRGNVISTSFQIFRLEYDTAYEVRIRCVRRWRGLEDTMDTTPVAEFTPKCEAPGTPRDVNITHQQYGSTITLAITWQMPGNCVHMDISNTEVKYRLVSQSEDNWNGIDLKPNETSAIISNLDPGFYVVRVVLANAEGITNFGEKYYSARLEIVPTTPTNIGSADISTTPITTRPTPIATTTTSRPTKAESAPRTSTTTRYVPEPRSSSRTSAAIGEDITGHCICSGGDGGIGSFDKSGIIRDSINLVVVICVVVYVIYRFRGIQQQLSKLSTVPAICQPLMTSTPTDDEKQNEDAAGDKTPGSAPLEKKSESGSLYENIPLQRSENGDSASEYAVLMMP